MKNINYSQWLSKNTKVLSLLTIGLLLLVSAFAAREALNIKTHYSLDQFQPSGHSLIKDSRDIQRRFGIQPIPSYSLILGLDTGAVWNTSRHIKLLDQITRDLQKKGNFNEVVSLTQVQTALSLDDRFDLGLVIELAQRDMDNLSWITQSSLLAPHLISSDGQETILLLKPGKNDSEKDLAANVTSIVNETIKGTGMDLNVSLKLGGAGVITNEMMKLLSKETILFVGMGLLASLILLALLFRSIKTIGMILIVIICSNAMSLAAMSLLGLSFTVLTTTVPILVTITVLAICSHSLMHLFSQYYKQNLERVGASGVSLQDRWTLIENGIKSLWFPHSLTALTTGVGFGTLLFSSSPVIHDFGYSVVVSVLIACFVSLLLLPALLLWVFYPVRPVTFSFDKLVDKIPKYRWQILFIGLMMLSFFGYRGGDLSWTSQLFNDLPVNHAVRRNTEHINKKLGGTIPLEVVITPAKSSWKDIDNVKTLARLTAIWKDIDAVKSSVSIIDFIRMADNNNELPDSSAALSEIYFLYGMAEEDPLKSYMLSGSKVTRIGLRLDDVPANKIEELKSLIISNVKSAFPGGEVRLGGMGATAHVISNELSLSLMKGFLHALICIFILLSLVFRSVKWALVATLPNLVPPLVLIGVLGFLEIPIKPGVAIVFSISLGIAFDNTVYILGRLQSLLREGKFISRIPVQSLMKEEAGACLISSSCLFIGFSIFLMSLFSVNQLFGFFMLISIVAGLFGDLILLPVVLYLWPRMLSIPGNKYQLVKR